MNLVDKTCEVFGMDLPNFARHIDMPKSTLHQWSHKKELPRYAVIMLKALIENKQLKEKDEAVKRVLKLYDTNTQTM